MKINKIMAAMILGMACSASAQILDLLGSGAIGGAMMKGNMASVNQGMKTLKYTQIIQALSQNAQIIRINHMGDYKRVGRSDIVGNPFEPYHFDIGSEQNNRFYIELSGVDVNMCQCLVAQNIGAIEVLINGMNKESNTCSVSSKIKFVFE